MKVTEFYGYKHWTLEEVSRCFYVGKGGKYRPHCQRRSHKWHAVVKRFGLRVEVCVGPVTNEEACAWEVEQIAQMKTFSTCFKHDTDDIGCNFTLGGEGATGRVHSEEAKRKIREARAKQVIPVESHKRSAEKRKGKPRTDTIWNKGLKLTEEQVKNFGGKQRGQKRSAEARANIAAAITAWHAKRRQEAELVHDVL